MFFLLLIGGTNSDRCRNPSYRTFTGWDCQCANRVWSASAYVTSTEGAVHSGLRSIRGSQLVENDLIGTRRHFCHSSEHLCSLRYEKIAAGIILINNSGHFVAR